MLSPDVNECKPLGRGPRSIHVSPIHVSSSASLSAQRQPQGLTLDHVQSSPFQLELLVRSRPSLRDPSAVEWGVAL